MKKRVRLFELSEGATLPEIKKLVIQDNINLYAEVSKDFNPIHIDADFARKTPAGGTIAHGMMILAYVSQMMTVAFGRNWLFGSGLSVRFRTPARPGDTITVSGEIRRVEEYEGRNLITCDIICRNQNGDPVITGEAKLKAGSNENSC